jgi:WD40 repeat protein
MLGGAVSGQRPADRHDARKLLAAVVAGLLLLAWLAVFSWLLPARPRATLVPREKCCFLRFSPDGTRLLTAGGTNSWPSYSGPLQVWGVESSAELLAVAEAWDAIETIRVSPDSRLLAAYQKEGDLKVWDIGSGREIFSLRPAAEFGYRLNFRFSPDWKYLLVQDHERDGQKTDHVRFWDIATGRERARVEAHWGGVEFTGPDKGLIVLRWKDRNQVKVQRWRFTAGEPLLSLAGEIDVLADKVALSPDRKILAAVREPQTPGQPAEIELRAVDSGTARLRFPAAFPGKHIQTVSFSPDGRVLAAHAGGETRGHWETESRLWDVSGGQARELGSFPDNPAFSPDGKCVAVPTKEGAILHDAGFLGVARELQRPGDRSLPLIPFANDLPYTTVRFSPDSRLIAVTGLFDCREQGPVIDWLSRNIPRFSTPRGGAVARVWDARTGREHASLPGCRELLFSPDGTTLPALGSEGAVELWDVPVHGPRGLIVGLSLLTWLASIGCCLGLRRLVARFHLAVRGAAHDRIGIRS